MTTTATNQSDAAESNESEREPSDDAPTPTVDQSVGSGSTQSPPPPRSKWALHRRMYDWVLSFAHHKHSTMALFLISFAESSFFPIPPDVLLGPLCLGNRRKSMWFATVCTVGSVSGAYLGYVIGYAMWETLNPYLFEYVPGFTHEKFETVTQWYDQWGVLALFGAAFTPLPYKIFTVAGGVLDQPLILFGLVSFIGRGMRFFLVAAVFQRFGPKALPLIDRHFNTLCIAFALLLVGGFLVLKWMA